MTGKKCPCCAKTNKLKSERINNLKKQCKLII